LQLVGQKFIENGVRAYTFKVCTIFLLKEHFGKPTFTCRQLSGNRFS
jgi:hypothetical protein